ncbi:uncharacterized protein LOC144165037 isoform X1 [Haemaphysalis longicornis]
MQGVYVDWNHPGDACGKPTDTDDLIAFINELAALGLKVILAVPPDPDVVKHYDLVRALAVCEYAVVKTHTLRLRGLIGCSGARVYAAHVFHQIRRSLPPDYQQKLAYSVSVGADSFTAASVQIYAPATGEAQWAGVTQQPEKMRYAILCGGRRGISIARFPNHPECALASRTAGTQFEVAAFMGPDEVLTRMRNSYDDGMGDVPIMVYDIELDDFSGQCNPHVTSPLIQALAIGTYNTR